jgi:hypothetical protein
MLLQWPHQGARNFTKTFLFDPKTAESKFLSVARNAEAFTPLKELGEKVKVKRAKMRNERDDLVVVIILD